VVREAIRKRRVREGERTVKERYGGD
jgi:hypothetical protein